MYKDIKKMNATQKQQILDLLQRYKEKFLNVSLAGPYKEGEKVNELYKWQLITDCEGKSTIELIKHFITTKPNVIYRQGDIPVFNYLITKIIESIIIPQPLPSL